MNNAFLVADIGGTNARLATAHPDTLVIDHIHTFKCADYSSLAEIVRAWSEAADQPLPSRGCFAVAGPVDNGRVQMTNLDWLLDGAQLARELGMTELQLINDFAALANAAPVLQANELHTIKPGTAKARAPLAIIGPGTGFGMAALIPASESQWLTLASEGGHIAFAPTTELERKLLERLSHKHQHVSVEVMLRGQGMVEIYQALCQLLDHPCSDYDVRAITELGLSGRDDLCHQTLDMYCAMLGSIAGDAALVYGARGGVYIGGGVVPRILKFIEHSNFIAHFTNKGPMADYLAPVPVQVMIADEPALLGAAYWLQQRAL